MQDDILDRFTVTKRKYQDYWLEVRTKGQVRIEMGDSKRKSVEVLMRREAERDKAFAIKLARESKKYFLGFVVLGDIMIVTLRLSDKVR